MTTEDPQDRWERRVIGIALLLATAGGALGLIATALALVDIARQLALTAGGLTIGGVSLALRK